jgi:serine/threonine protein kinase
MSHKDNVLKFISNDDINSFRRYNKINNININQLIPNIVIECCKKQAWKIAEYIIGIFEVDLNCIDEDGNTALMYAFFYHQFDFAMMLLDFGFTNINQRNKGGFVALTLIKDTTKLSHTILERLLTPSNLVIIPEPRFRKFSDVELSPTQMKGSYGDIYYDHVNGHMIKRSRMNNGKTPNDIIREMLLLRMINIVNPKLAVRLEGIYVKNDECSLVMEELSYSLYDVFDTYRNIDITSKSCYFKAIYKAILENVDKLNNMGILHRDLKPNNIMIDKEGHVRMIDFGISEIVGIGNKKIPFIGTSNFKAPDDKSIQYFWYKTNRFKINSNSRNYTSDVFSVASIIVYSILQRTVCLFFDHGTIYEYTQKDNQSGVVRSQNKSSCTLSLLSASDIDKFNEFSPDLLNLLSWMFNVDSNIRYTAKECLQHRFFTNIEYKRPFVNTSINIAECEISPYTNDEILFQRGDLKYGEEIFDFYKERSIPVTKINDDILNVIESFFPSFNPKVEDFDVAFNRNISLTSISEEINHNIYNVIYTTKGLDNDRVIDSLLQLLSEEYVPISITSVIEFYITKLRSTGVISSIIDLFRNTIYTRFYNYSISKREKVRTVDSILREVLMELSLERDIPLPIY